MKLDQVPPQNVDAERAVLGAMLMPGENVVPIVMPLLVNDDFYSKGNACIFGAITTLYEVDAKIDLLTVVEQLTKDGTLDKTVGVAEINVMIESVPSAANVEYYAEMIRIASMRRNAIAVAAKMYKELLDDTLEFDDVIASAEKAILDIRMDRIKNPVSPIKAVIQSTTDRLNKISDNPDGLLGIATGFHELDSLIQGIQKSELTVVVGRPGMGKSMLVHQIGVYAAQHCKEPTCIFSLEMPEEALGMRIASSISGVPFEFVRRANMTDTQWSKIFQVFNDLVDVPLFIDDTPGISIEEIRARCHQMVSSHGLGVVIVDYFQLIAKKGKSDTRLAELENISQSLKNLARSLDIAVVLAAQLNRNLEGRPDKRPQLSDIKSCGKLEEDADVVLGIYRDSYYPPKDKNDHSAEILILKQRNGPLGTAHLEFDGNRVRFLNKRS